MKKYDGTLCSKYMTKEVKRAYQSWADQRARCYNKKCRSFKWYGAKGIKVRYGSREFIYWWMKEASKKVFIKPSVSRKNHDGHYEFKNIKLEELSSNCSEPARIRRVFDKKVIMFDCDSKRILREFTSVEEASTMTQLSRSLISSFCTGKYRYYKLHQFNIKVGFRHG